MILPAERGIAVLCDARGVVLRRLRDELGLEAQLPAGSPLGNIADAGVEEKVGRFLATIQEKSAAFDWEITTRLGDELIPLHFAGALVDGGILVVAARTRSGLARMNDELMQINNEQANSLRTISRELGLATVGNAERDDTLFDELSRLNNELATLQRDLASRNADLARLNEQKNRLLGMAAHDLRSPLGVIQSYSEFLQSEAADVLDAEQREFVAAILDASRFMLGIIDDLLDVAQIEAGTLRLELAPTDLVDLVRRNITLNRLLAGRKDIALEFQPPASPVELSLDPRKIEQVLNNLVGNAIKFSFQGTTVRIELQADDSSARITVRDEGQGIPEADLPKLFQPFGRTSVRGTAGEQSTGLGLAIVRRIVEGHGGRIRVESEVGLGSAFTVELPLASLAARPTRPET